ncbi:MAG: hypothetical protein DRQ40_09990, partial [Gammaproteobacteria bacterium]
MGIVIQHQVPVATAGGIAYEAGLGEFQKEADKFYEGQRQFDEQMAQREAQMAQQQEQFRWKMAQDQNQFGRNMGYRYDLANMQNEQQNRRMGESAYQFDAGLQDRGLDRMARYQIADERNQLAGKEIEQRGASALSRETRADQRLMQTQMSRTGLAAAANINKHQFRSEEQKQQAVDQWVQQYGDYFDGQFPYATPYQSNANHTGYGTAIKQFEQAFGNSEDAQRFAGMIYGPSEDGEQELLIDASEIPGMMMSFQNNMEDTNTKRMNIAATQQEKSQKEMVSAYGDMRDMEFQRSEAMADLLEERRKNNFDMRKFYYSTLKVKGEDGKFEQLSPDAAK